MVSFTSRKSSLNSSSFFKAAKLFSGLFFLALAIHGSSSLPVNKRQTTEDEPIINIRKETYWSMNLLTRINMNKLNITEEDDIRIGGIADNLNTTVLCNMYDFYRDYTTALSTVQPNDPLRAVYSATQYAAWEAMNSACQWINSTSSLFASDGCTLTSITRTCFLVRHHRTFYQKEKVRPNGKTISRTNPKWLNTTDNGLPECASTIILESVA